MIGKGILKGMVETAKNLAGSFHDPERLTTVEYPEQKPYLAPRYRGRIVLTKDPDGEERCVACNLCAVACPVGCIALQQG
ncbi:MAG: 4Fe-4S binding protein, partial [Verrucomicrobiales bacterium]